MLTDQASKLHNAIVLDVMLPRRDGFDVCRPLRKQGMSVPILMLTAPDTVEDCVAWQGEH